MENSNQSSRKLDVAIVGAGVIGLACAWRLAARGLRVRVLERDRPGSGASGVAAGMLAPVGEATYGEDALLDLALRSHHLWPEFARELADASGGDPGFIGLGALHVALDRDETEALRRRFELMESLGLEAEWIRGGACRDLEPGLSPRVAAGVLARHEAAVDPRRLVGALRVAAEGAGAEVVTGAEVIDVVVEAGSASGVRTADGEHRCDDGRPRRRGVVRRRAAGRRLSRRPCARSRARSSPSGSPAGARHASGSSSASASTWSRATTAGSSSARPSRSSGSTAGSPPAASTSCCARDGGRCPTSMRWSCSRRPPACAPGRPTTRR